MKIVTLSLFTAFCTFTSLAQNTTLTVKCYESNSVFNGIMLNNQYAEYGFADTGFYVGVLDYTTCELWKTNYNNSNPAHDFGNYNNDGGSGRMRSEGFFIFQYGDANQLNGMLNMLQQIPENNQLIIYTPAFYDPALVAATSPALLTELENRWGASALADPQIKVLFGKQGDAASYVSAVPAAGADSVLFSAPVCSALGLNEAALQDVRLVQLNKTTWEVSGLEKVSEVELYGMNGQRSEISVNGNTLTLSEELSNGIYILRGNSEKGIWQGRLFVH